jgi:hypothetical protein
MHDPTKGWWLKYGRRRVGSKEGSCQHINKRCDPTNQPGYGLFPVHQRSCVPVRHHGDLGSARMPVLRYAP